MKSACSTVAATRWLSLRRVTKWLSKHPDAVILHLDEKAPACAPPPSWWVLLLAVEAFMAPVDVSFKLMQGLTTFVSEQGAMLDKLAGDLRDILEMIGPISNGALMEMSKDDTYVASKEFPAGKSSVRDLFADLGHFDLSRYTALADDDKERLESAVGKLLLKDREGITAIGAERAADNSISHDNYTLSFPGISGI
jgi:hypothetical protein